jgi:XRE family aerobic/anaerobic benzoate catabolism transcriptional regulator
VHVEAEQVLSGLGARVRARRAARRWTLKQLAQASGVSERFLSDLEAGRGNISVARLCDVARALGVRPAELLEGDVPRAPARVVALLGLRGAGKSTVGPKLASRLRLPFFELDGLIEAEAGLGVAEIFALHGEDYYRRLERSVLARFLDRGEGAVLATGGGVVNSPEAMRLLEERCVTVWLKAAPEDHWERVVKQGDSRPMRGNPHAMSELRALLARREPLYARARHQVDTGKLGVRGSVEALAQALRPD